MPRKPPGVPASARPFEGLLAAPVHPRTSCGWLALGLALGGCDAFLGIVAILPPSEGGVEIPPPDGDSSARDGSAAGDADVAPLARDCVDLIDLSAFAGDGGTGSSIAGQTVMELGCTRLDGGMWLEPANSSVWSRPDGGPLLEANQRYSFYFNETVNVMKLRLTGGRGPCDTDEVYEEHPPSLLPRLPAPPACRTLSAPFDVHYLRHSGGQAVFLPNPLNPGSYQLCKGPCEGP
jgi:hypothetical protein